MTDELNLTPHVASVLCAQDAYVAQAPSTYSRAVRAVSAPLTAATRRFVPAEAIEAAIKGADWVASASIRDSSLDHDFSDLEACEAAVAEVRRWSMAYAVTGGGAAGALGAAGLAMDIPATLTLALRTTRLVGLCYGFGGTGAAEQVYILDVLHLAGANSQEERDQAFKHLADGRSKLGPGDWQNVSEMVGHAAAAGAATRRVALVLGANLSARKMGQVVPFLGAAVGASVNAAFQKDVADAAQYAFRARWLEVNARILEER